LPLPEGPVSITRPFERVTLPSCERRNFIAGDWPIISVGPESRFFSLVFSRRRREVSIARPITTSNWSVLKGFSMKS